MYLDFMTPAVWDVLVVVVTLVGLALAGRQIIKNRAANQREQQHTNPQHDRD